MDNAVGKVVWTDLTVPDAVQIRDFYSQVVGWEFQAVEMGDYADFSMMAPGATEPAAGICHTRGTNAALPAQWLIYITVADLDQAIAQCVTLGGKLLVEPKAISDTQRYAVIQEPAGAIAALLG